MKIALWVLSFVFLVIATLTGIGASIGVIDTDWFVVCVLCLAGMYSAAGCADKYDA